MRTLVVSKLSKASRANLDWWSFPLGGVIWSHGVMVILRRAPSLNHRATQIRRNVLKARDCKSSKSFQDSHIFQRKRSPKITNKSKKMKPMHKNVREKKKKSGNPSNAWRSDLDMVQHHKQTPRQLFGWMVTAEISRQKYSKKYKKQASDL